MKTIAFILALMAFFKPETKNVNTEYSVIHWKGTKFGGAGSQSGTLRLQSGQVELNGGRLSGGKFIIDMKSLEPEIPASDPVPRRNLKNHLSSDHFFDVNKYPQAVFRITSVHYQSANKCRVSGNLTLRGVTKPLSFSASSNTGVFKARVVFDRQRWGVTSNHLEDKVIGDDIELHIGIRY